MELITTLKIDSSALLKALPMHSTVFQLFL